MYHHLKQEEIRELEEYFLFEDMNGDCSANKYKVLSHIDNLLGRRVKELRRVFRKNLRIANSVDMSTVLEDCSKEALVKTTAIVLSLLSDK